MLSSILQLLQAFVSQTFSGHPLEHSGGSQFENPWSGQFLGRSPIPNLVVQADLKYIVIAHQILGKFSTSSICRAL